MDLVGATKLVEEANKAKIASQPTQTLQLALIRAKLRMLDTQEGLIKEAYKDLIAAIESELLTRGI